MFVLFTLFTNEEIFENNDGPHTFTASDAIPRSLQRLFIFLWSPRTRFQDDEKIFKFSFRITCIPLTFMQIRLLTWNKFQIVGFFAPMFLMRGECFATGVYLPSACVCLWPFHRCSRP